MAELRQLLESSLDNDRVDISDETRAALLELFADGLQPTVGAILNSASAANASGGVGSAGSEADQARCVRVVFEVERFQPPLPRR